MSEYDLQFDSGAWDQLDDFALTACQDYNYGNANNWFNCFRGGLYGMRSRLQAARRHFIELHAWIPEMRIVADPEYHLSTTLFHMDSSIECMVFALNAIGNCVSPDDFRDVTAEKALRNIRLSDIIGDKPQPGYATYFPRLQEHLQSNEAMIKQVMDQHDVSKHRETIFKGGSSRDDPPPDFYDRLGLAEDDLRRSLYWPMKTIILDPNPKSPKYGKDPIPRKDQIIFEVLASNLAGCLSEAAEQAFQDVTQTIPLAARKRNADDRQKISATESHQAAFAHEKPAGRGKN